MKLPGTEVKMGKEKEESIFIEKNGQSKIISLTENIHIPFISGQDLEPESQNRKAQATFPLSIPSKYEENAPGSKSRFRTAISVL